MTPKGCKQGLTVVPGPLVCCYKGDQLQGLQKNSRVQIASQLGKCLLLSCSRDGDSARFSSHTMAASALSTAASDGVQSAQG